METGTEAAQFLFWEYITGIFIPIVPAFPVVPIDKEVGSAQRNRQKV